MLNNCSVTYVSEQVLPMSPVYIPPRFGEGQGVGQFPRKNEPRRSFRSDASKNQRFFRWFFDASYFLPTSTCPFILGKVSKI